MRYPDLNVTSSELVRLLVETEKFAEVTYAGLQTPELLAGELADRVFPCVRISFERAYFRRFNAVRELNWIISVLDQRPVDADGQAALDARLEILNEMLTGPMPGQGLQLNGVNMLLRSFCAEPVSGEILLHRFRLRGTAAGYATPSGQ